MKLIMNRDLLFWAVPNETWEATIESIWKWEAMIEHARMQETATEPYDGRAHVDSA